jgi:hypothetical protein
MTVDGDMRTDVIAVITQRRELAGPAGGTVVRRGGCTLVLDRREGVPPIRYSVTVPVSRRAAVADGMAAMAMQQNPYGDRIGEAFAALHRV